MKSKERICYKYRGILYQKSKPQKCITNLIAPRDYELDRYKNRQEFTYRGVSYTVSTKKTPIDITTSFPIQKYRGINYLVHVVNLLTDTRPKCPKNLKKTSTDIST